MLEIHRSTLLTLQNPTPGNGQWTQLRLFLNLSLFFPFSGQPSQPPLNLAFIPSLLDAHGTSMQFPKQEHSGPTNLPGKQCTAMIELVIV